MERPGLVSMADPCWGGQRVSVLKGQALAQAWLIIGSSKPKGCGVGVLPGSGSGDPGPATKWHQGKLTHSHVPTATPWPRVSGTLWRRGHDQKPIPCNLLTQGPSLSWGQ